MSDGELIFVYGTLRSGGTRDAEAFYPGARFLGPGRVRGALHHLGDYPGIRLDETAGWVVGNLVHVTPEALAGFDEWEGIDASTPTGGPYRRVQAHVTRPDGSLAIAWVYEAAAARVEGHPVIASGDWLAAH